MLRECLLISSLPDEALRMLVDIAGLGETKRILGKCLWIPSLPGKALRTLIDISRLIERFNMRSQSQAW